MPTSRPSLFRHTLHLLVLCAAIPLAASAEPGAPLFEGLGGHHHPISTRVPEAQRYFDQGLILAYAFNHAEAERSFREAARLDPTCAICWWGVALVLGPNINLPMDESAAAPAWSALQRALSLIELASPKEAAYIRALAPRYAEQPPADRSALDQAFAVAMRAVVSEYPDDLDARTLLAEALMDTMPWDYWIRPDLAKPETIEILDHLEHVLERNPDHPGALHLYIHAVEASSAPDGGEGAADRHADRVPGAGPIVDTP
ncbi:MAG: hypothetical protein JJT85_02190 [Chromatiales bacterium]|nr:hypothetical protein [Chromatiales bacterium]